MSEPVLYSDVQWISPYVFSCFVTLQEKRVDFKLRELDLDRGDQKDPAFAALSLTGRVPALEHDGFTVSESLAIVEYLEEAFPATRVLPGSVRERARARQLLSWLRSDDTASIRAERSTHTMFLGDAAAPLSGDATRAVAKLFAVAGALVEQATDGHLFGGGFTVADADLSFMLHRLLLNGDVVPVALRRWAEGVWQRDSLRLFRARGSSKHLAKR